MQETMVPKQLPGLQGDLLGPIHHQLDHLVEVSKTLEIEKCTYALPVGTFLGFMSALLKWAKKSSQGAAS